AASSVRATSPPTLPVIPVTAYIVLSSGSLNIGFATAIEPARPGGAARARCDCSQRKPRGRGDEWPEGQDIDDVSS
ncbi:hypothetical protein PPH41_43185, partial [Burkholderia gladioli]|nr:hypothetical protein [Burkholderia gladioli]